MWRALLVAGALCLATAPAASATPGMVVGDGSGWIYLSVGGNPSVEVDFAPPAFDLDYSSFGTYHEDGYDTSWSEPGNGEIYVGMDVYAYAFSKPMVATPLSEVVGVGAFDDGVFATITNTSASAQSITVSIETYLRLFLGAEQPYDLTYGSIGYTLTGLGATASPFTRSVLKVLPPSATGGTTGDGFSETLMLDLAAGETYGFRLDDFHIDFFLRAQSVPEPATWAMLILGFGAVGARLRRRPSTAARAAIAMAAPWQFRSRSED